MNFLQNVGNGIVNGVRNIGSAFQNGKRLIGQGATFVRNIGERVSNYLPMAKQIASKVYDIAENPVVKGISSFVPYGSTIREGISEGAKTVRDNADGIQRSLRKVTDVAKKVQQYTR